jgi:hypothetical protein
LEIRDKKGVENSMADHLSRLQLEEFTELPINDYMRDDALLKVSSINTWYANIVNYIIAGYIPLGATRRRSSETIECIYGMILICIEYALMAYLEDAY